MIRKLTVLFLALVLLAPAIVGAAEQEDTVEKEDFVVRTTEDLIDLCTPPPGHPLADEAIHFCEGYCVGAYHYYLAANAGPDGARWICFDDPPPSRDSVIAKFVEWAQKNPQYMKENPVESLFRFLIQTWPCKK